MAVAVVVGDGGSHTCLLTAIFIERRSRRHCDVSKGSVVVVTVKNAGSAIARNENIGPAVFVEIQRGNAERVMPVGAIDMRLGSDVFERTVAFVVIKNILRARQTAAGRTSRETFPYTGGPLAWRGRRRKIKIHIVGYDQVEPAVAIIVNKCAACSPAFPRAGDSSFLRYFGEDAALIMVEPVLAVVGDVQILPAIVVVISNADALPQPVAASPALAVRQ